MAKQHVDVHRKLMLRRTLLRYAVPGAVYVPFVGDGDIAVELYADRSIFAADLDADRVGVARSRLAGADVREADCDRWPFADITVGFAVADFDSYCYPYDSFRAFWEGAEKADRLVLFFTDGIKQGVVRAGVYRRPDGSVERGLSLVEKREIFNKYFAKHVFPWFVAATGGWRMVRKLSYLRGSMLYWGAVIKRL